MLALITLISDDLRLKPLVEAATEPFWWTSAAFERLRSFSCCKMYFSQAFHPPLDELPVPNRLVMLMNIFEDSAHKQKTKTRKYCSEMTKVCPLLDNDSLLWLVYTTQRFYISDISRADLWHVKAVLPMNCGKWTAECCRHPHRGVSLAVIRLPANQDADEWSTTAGVLVPWSCIMSFVVTGAGTARMTTGHICCLWEEKIHKQNKSHSG